MTIRNKSRKLATSVSLLKSTSLKVDKNVLISLQNKPEKKKKKYQYIWTVFAV